MYLLHYFYLYLLVFTIMYLVYDFTSVLYITMYLSIYALKIGD